MGNETSSEGGTVAATHVPDDTNRAPGAMSQNVSVKTESNAPVISHLPGKIMDEDINVVPMIKQEIKPIITIKKEEDNDPPHPTHGGPKSDEREIMNSVGGYSFKVCDLNRLRRYIVLGSEECVYYCTPGQSPNLKKGAQNLLDNIKCLKSLLSQGRHEEVLDIITEYSLSGRVAKEDPILTVLAWCAEHEDVEIRKAAYKKVVEICNIPTKLFRFVDLLQITMVERRKKNPPAPQKSLNDKNRKRRVEVGFETMKISDDNAKVPSENIDTSLEPVKKKTKKKGKVLPEYKKVNVAPKKSSGWGRLRRKAIAEFYTDDKKNATRLLYLMTKYKQRHNWSHKLLMSYAHPKMVSEDKETKNLVLQYCTHGYDRIKDKCMELVKTPGIQDEMSEIINYIKVIEDVSNLSPEKEGDEEKLLNILNTYGVREQPKEFTTTTTVGKVMKTEKNIEGKKSSIHVVREHLPTGFLNSKKVWETLLCDMPMTAMIRNLGKMSSLGLFDDPEHVKTVVNALTNVHKLKTARVHPVKILISMQTYSKGKGEKGSLQWPVNQTIAKALDDSFYLSFKQPEVKGNFKTYKKYMLCLDVSGSMTFAGCHGCEFLTPAMASAAMAWVTWNVEDEVELMAFGGHLEDMKKLGFSKDMLIKDVIYKCGRMNFGATDCALPMVYALEKRKEIDVFVVYTDSETWIGRVHPATALKNYNRTMNRAAKLIVCGMQSNAFSIADPQDPNMMDVVGFDTSVPELISEFAKGKLSSRCSGACEDCHKSSLV